MVTKAVRDIGNRQNVLGDIVARDAISPRGGADESAVLVEERDRHAVHLRLDGEMNRAALGELADAGDELAQLLGRVGIVETLHRHEVLRGGELLERFAAHAACRGILSGEFGVLVLEVLEFPQQSVELLIGNLRRGVLVIKPVVTLEFGPETIHALADSGFVEIAQEIRLRHASLRVTSRMRRQRTSEIECRSVTPSSGNSRTKASNAPRLITQYCVRFVATTEQTGLA